MKIFVFCPACGAEQPVPIESDELREGMRTGGLEHQCDDCGTAFAFDVSPEITNKREC